MRRYVEHYTLDQDLVGRRSRRKIALKLRLDADLDGLVAQMAAAAQVSKSTPRQATVAHGAVILTILE